MARGTSELTRGDGDLYAIGRIVAVRAERLPAHVPTRTTRRISRAGSPHGTVGRLAIANPEHAPYGRAAEQALRALGLWEAAAPSACVLGRTSRRRRSSRASGNADGGIIAYSLALVAGTAPARLASRCIPESLHAPLRQRMVLLGGASPAPQRFYEYLRSPASRAILARYGLSLPGE